MIQFWGGVSNWINYSGVRSQEPEFRMKRFSGRMPVLNTTPTNYFLHTMKPHLSRSKSPSRHAGLDPASRFSLDSGFCRNDKIGNVGVVLIVAKDLGYGDTLQLMSQLEEVSKLLEACTASILNSGS